MTTEYKPVNSLEFDSHLLATDPMIKMFSDFVHDDSAWDMFITGPAGSGKTTDVARLIKICAIANINYLVCAHTNDAVDILRTKLPHGTKLSTLHSYLKKRPVARLDATDKDRIVKATQTAKPDRVSLVFIDELSTVGEKDALDLRSMQDEDYDGKPTMKIVWIGDMNQLLPVKDAVGVKPGGDYWLKLTTLKRIANNNKLHEPLAQLTSFIDGTAEPAPLVTNEQFVRGVPDIVDAYLQCTTGTKLFLAYTNARVQEINALVAGRVKPQPGDKLFCATTNKHVIFNSYIDKDDIDYIDRCFDGPLGYDSKYKTLEFLLTSPDIACEYYSCTTEDGEDVVWPVVFGVSSFKKLEDSLAKAAATSNDTIARANRNVNAATWAKANDTHPMARARAKAWRNYLTFKECVVSLDFPFAKTVHKSQGWTVDHVFLDSNNLAICRDSSYDTYLRLFYVAISRAAKTVTTN
ncbi:ATP dependent DNA helicase dda [Caudoviricetes sp.]|nr:ATP dependent DNA helicase dda [Caudoviricetes sp.]